MICTPPDARGSILRDCNHLWRAPLHPTGTQGRIKAPFAGTICSTPFLKSLLFEHGREAHSNKCVEGVFCELRLNGVLGSLAQRCPAKLAEHVSDGRAELPTRSTFRWMPLHPSRDTIEGTLMEGGSKWARFCGTVRATTDEIG